MFLRLSRNRKATEKQPKRKPKNFQTLLSQCFSLFFVFCFSVFSVVEKCIEMSGVLPKKSCVQKSCQLTDWSVGRGRGKGRVFGHVFRKNRKTEKNFSKSLIFNGLTLFGILFGGFSVAFRWLFGAEKILDFQRFAKHHASACLSMLLRIFTVRGWGVKQGIRWLGLVFGLVLSKGAKVWCPVWVLGGAKQTSKGLV
jgi:hypothetical protein